MLGFHLGITASVGSLIFEPEAPSGLAVSIEEATLEFGDTATAVVTVAGNPTPTLAYQWTLDGVDEDGQTGATYEGVPVGALRVRVTATNTEGSDGPVTSDPVTVAALEPDAFSPGQWTVDATGAIEVAAITLFGLPAANGAAISSVERAAGTERGSSYSTYEDLAYVRTAIAPFTTDSSPWGMGDKEGGVLRTWTTYGGPQGVRLYVRADDIPLGVGLPAGAPYILCGQNYDVETDANPFTQDSLRGFRSDEINELTARAVWTDRGTDPDRSTLIAYQGEASLDRTQIDGWDTSGATHFEFQIRPSPTAGVNFPAMTGDDSYTATIAGIEWSIVRSITSNRGANTRSYGFQPTVATVSEAPIKAILDWIVANEVANFAQAQAFLWFYGVNVWVEPRSGDADMVISDFSVTFNGTEYTSLPTWTALAGIDLNTAYNVTGLLDAEQTDFAIRAVNSIGNGPVSDTKLETPFRSVVPTQLASNEWTFDAVASSTDLLITINRPATDETGIQVEIDDVLKVITLDTDLLNGPVNLDVPTISGEPSLGETLTATGGRFNSLSGVTSSTWRWLRNGTAISGATATTYTLVEADNGAAIKVEQTATDAQGSTVAVSDPTQVELNISVTPNTGDWYYLDLSDYFPAEFAITSGTLPTGLTFESSVGIIHGVPTTAGESIISLTATGDVTIPFTLTIDVTNVAAAYSKATFDGSSFLYRGTLGAVTGSGTPSPIADSTIYCAFFDVGVPATLTDTGMLSNGSRQRARILSTGAVQIEIDNTSGSNCVLAQTNLGGGATDVRNGRHRIGITATTGSTPTLVITIDGVAQPLTTTTLAAGTIDHTNMYYAVGCTSGMTPTQLAPNNFDFYQVALWTDRAIDWTIAGKMGFDADAYGGAMLVIGGSSSNWTTPTIRGQTSASAWSISGSAPTVTAIYGEDTTPRAFMEATGYGRYTTGGLGETLYRVTNTSNSAATSGSLPWALAQSVSNGGGYILIEAEGACELTDRLFVLGSNITIDARRSPGLGFWLTGASLWIERSNVLVRGLRSYAGSNFIGQSTTGRDCIIIAHRTVGQSISNVYLDRCSAMFSIDEAVSLYPYRSGSSVKDVTIDGLFVAEPCHTNIHLDETGVIDDHAKGLIIAADNGAVCERVTVINSLLASIDDRAPRVAGATSAEFISCVTANYGSTGIQVSSTSSADFINTFFMLGDRPGAPTTTSSKWVQGTTSTTLEAVYESGCFTGAWTDAGGFDDAAMIDNWRNNTSASTYMDASALDNPHLFTKSGAHAGAASYSDAFAALGDTVGAISTSGKRHPFEQRVITYVTEDTPFTTGNYSSAYQDNMCTDEARAVGITIASGGAGALTVTLLAANTSLPPVTDRPWDSVFVTVCNAWQGEFVDQVARPDRTAFDWDDGVTKSGSLAGGAVAFTGLPSGWYVARIVYNAKKGDGVVPVTVYTGRPVQVA